jgi:hypothetical protein
MSVSNSDFNDWAIQSDGGTTSGIENAIVQRYKGIEIFRAVF